MIGIGFIFAIGPAIALICLTAAGYWVLTRYHPGGTSPAPGQSPPPSAH